MAFEKGYIICIVSAPVVEREGRRGVFLAIVKEVLLSIFVLFMTPAHNSIVYIRATHRSPLLAGNNAKVFQISTCRLEGGRARRTI